MHGMQPLLADIDHFYLLSFSLSLFLVPFIYLALLHIYLVLLFSLSSLFVRFSLIFVPVSRPSFLRRSPPLSLPHFFPFLIFVLSLVVYVEERNEGKNAWIAVYTTHAQKKRVK